MDLGYKIEAKIDAKSTKDINFYELLQMLFNKASNNQIIRLLNFIGINVQEKSKENEIIPKKNSVDPRIFVTYKMLFEKYDTNQDGVVDLKELKSGLKNILIEETIENLYNLYHSNSQGLSLIEFIKLYAPANIELPENL